MELELMFSIHHYHRDGSKFEDGIYLHFGETRIRVAEDPNEYLEFVNHLQQMYSYIKLRFDEHGEQ